MYYLSRELYFPPYHHASAEGIIAIGGDLSPERLILAYRNGIFPWFSEDEPKLWWCPPKRMVLYFDQSFEEVIDHCQQINRNDQDGTWITDEMKIAYIKLHELGVAKSVEVWQDNKLVGGLYGIDLGHIFCGESMFSLVSNASKLAFIKLAKKLEQKKYKLIDCQVYNDHLASLGATEIEREEFLMILKG
jgi:leucyl/phenylalanyl-tRNA---protein transferase